MLYANDGPTPIYVGGKLIPAGTARPVDPALIPPPPVAAEEPAADAGDTEQPTPEPASSMASDPGDDGETPIQTDEPPPADAQATEKASRKKA